MSPENIDVDIDIDEVGHFEALSKQPMEFQDALAELIDNSISASIETEQYFNEENPSEHFRIQITIVRYEDRVEVIVADSGKGIDTTAMSQHIFKSGDTEKATGILNEHGMGLKNALCVLTKNKGEEPFKIMSRTEETPENQQALVRGPFRKDMEVEIDNFEDQWPEGAEALETLSKGTRVHFTTSYDMVKAMWPRAKHLEKMMRVLMEHLGVMYRHFLQHTHQNHITILWEDKIQNEGKEWEVKPIFPVFKEGVDTDGEPLEREDTIEVKDEDGEIIKIKYHRGIVDWHATREKYKRKLDEENIAGSEEDDSPFRIYYRRNQRTQGVDIIYMGRTLNTAEIEKIWDNITCHNRYNYFVGEIILDSKKFETVNNKIQIDRTSGLWEDLKQQLNDNTYYGPIGWGKEEKEKSIKIKLKEKLEAESATQKVLREKGYNGVDIDLLQFFDEGYEYLYEVKRLKARPLDVYQLVMYWDAYKKDQYQHLRRAFLVAPDISDNARAIISDWNERQDANGENYSLSFKDISDYGLDEE